MALHSPAPEAFRALRVVEEIAISIAHPQGGATWGKAEGRIDARPDAVLAHLLDFERLPRHVPRLAEVRVIQRSPPGAEAGAAIVYFRFALPWPIADREYTARYAWNGSADSGFEVTVEDEGPLAPAPSAVRVTELRGHFRLAPDGAGTRAIYLFTADFGGRLPSRVRDEAAWRQPLETLRGIRRALR